MGGKNSILQWEDPGDELVMFLTGEQMDEEAIMKLLKFKIRPVRSMAEEESFHAVCSHIKANVNQQMNENLGKILEILADFDVFTNTSVEEVWFLHNGVFFIKWLFNTYSELIGEIITSYPEVKKKFLKLLVNIISKVEVTDQSYHLVMEATDILSIVSYSTNHLEVLGMETLLMKSLLVNLCAQKSAPVFPFGLKSGMGHAIASGMWTVMTAGLGSWTESVDVNFKPLADKSLDLIKELIETRVSCVTVLSNLKDLHDVNFSDLHYILLGNPDNTFLLKALLAINMAYRKFVITGTDIALLICPILKDIYESNKDDSDISDELFSILQILVTDEMFNKAIHSSCKLGQVLWYKERYLKNIKLGGLIILVLIRAVLNSRIPQKLRGSCIDILTDMSGHFQSLDLYPAERIVCSIESLLKKYVMPVSSEDGFSHGYVVKDLILIVDNCIVNQTQQNPNILHSLLYKKDVLKDLVDQNPHFLPYVVNIFDIIDFLTQAIEEVSDDFEKVLDTEALMKTIKEAAFKYPKSYFVDIIESDNSEEERRKSNTSIYEQEYLKNHSSSCQNIESKGNNLGKELVIQNDEELILTDTSSNEVPFETIEPMNTLIQHVPNLKDDNSFQDQRENEITTTAIESDKSEESKGNNLGKELVIQNDEELILTDTSSIEVPFETIETINTLIQHVPNLKDDNSFQDQRKNETTIKIVKLTLNSILDDMNVILDGNFSKGTEQEDTNKKENIDTILPELQLKEQIVCQEQDKDEISKIVNFSINHILDNIFCKDIECTFEKSLSKTITNEENYCLIESLDLNQTVCDTELEREPLGPNLEMIHQISLIEKEDSHQP